MSKCKRESDDTSKVQLLGILGCRAVWQRSANPYSEGVWHLKTEENHQVGRDL